jgi:prophage regulatory protein
MATDPSPPSKSSILRQRKLSERTGLSRSTIYNKLDPNSPMHDPTFPQQVRLSANAVGWLESEVEIWINSRSVDQPSVGRSREKASTEFKPNDMPRDDLLIQGMIEKFMRDKRVQTLEGILDRRARTGSRILLQDAMEYLMLDPIRPDDKEELERVIETISRNSHIERKGLLGVLVHEPAVGESRPTVRFLELAKALGYQYDSVATFTRSQIEFLFELREDPTGKSKGQLRWSSFKNKPLLSRS